MNKPVYINGRFLSQQITGVQRFAWGMSSALADLGYFPIFICPKDIIHKPAFGQVIIHGNLKGHVWEQVDLPQFLRRNNSPMLFNFCNSAPLNYSKNFVTLHDIAFIKNPEWFSAAFVRWYKFIIPRIISKALYISTVSEFSKKEIQNHFEINPEKILVIPNGIYLQTSGKIEKEPFTSILEQPFILFVGSISERKRTSFLMDSFQKKEFPENLIIAGSKFNVITHKDVRIHPKIIHLHPVSDDLLVLLYKHASLLIMPSVYEGFGLPVLEAQSFGCPVLCSDLPVFRETFNNSVEYFEADDEANFLEILSKTLINNDLRSDLISKGFKNASNYSYLKSAKRIEEFIEK